MTRILGLIGSSIFFAVILTHVGAHFYANWVERKAYSERGWEATQVNGKPTIQTVDADGPAVALCSGDEVVSLTVEPQNACPLLNRNECTVPAGTGYRLIIRRNGEKLEFDLATAPNRLSRQLIDFAFNLLTLTFVVTGLTVLLLKPDDKQVWLLALMLCTFVGWFSGTDAFLPEWAQVVSQLARVCAIAFFPLFLHFFLIFPQRGPWVRRFPRLEYWLHIPFLALILPINMVQRFGGQKLVAAIPGTKFISIFATLLGITYLVLGLAVMAVNYRAADSVNRRRTRVILVGCGAGVLNFLLIIGSQNLGFNRIYPRVFYPLLYGMLATLPLIPLSIIYAIIRHQVIPVSLIIRRSVRYLLVSRGSILLELIVVIVAVTAVLTYIFSRSRPSGIVIGLVSAGVGIAAWKVSETLHDKYLAPVIDRRFFRQSYDAHQIIAELTQSLRTVTGLPHLLELLGTRIQSALQTEYVTIYLRDPATRQFNSAYSSDHREPDPAADNQSADGHLDRYARMVEKLDWLGKFVNSPQAPYLTQLESDNACPIEIGPDNYSSDYDGAALLMPLLSKDEILGIISLGPRLGDLPFSGEDKQLLMSVSGPTTLAIENARLVEQMVAEARRLQEIEVDHRRKTEELAFARQLQLSMLPTRNVMLDSIEIIGRMRTASEVGGDYYDFIEMTDGRICIAIGDATGHGMAAGLVVGMVKMGLINGLQKLNGSTSIKPLVEDLNRALKRSLSQRGMGMCLGAAILDSSTLKAEVFSNGMPAPYHYRAGCRSLLPIATQAPPLGFLREVSVRPVEIQMESGDALLWLSDGFEERLDRMNQVWGSELVAQTLERVCGEEISADDISRRMIEACDSAAGGRSNHDDMTIVVAKVKGESIFYKNAYQDKGSDDSSLSSGILNKGIDDR
jgi:phosphoserine phosphatase RsbU/P